MEVTFHKKDFADVLRLLGAWHQTGVAREVDIRSADDPDGSGEPCYRVVLLVQVLGDSVSILSS